MPKKMIDEQGKQYGFLIVKEKALLPNRNKMGWLCECQLCGGHKIISGSDLRANKYTSCGCKRQNIIIEKPGTIYGFLKVIKEDPTPAKNFADKTTHWICECQKCGTTKSISGRSLRSGETTSCGCIESIGEQIIAKILNKNNISYKKEVKFDDLLSDKNNKLRFDFGVYENDKLLCLVEFQGKQHREENSYFRDSLKERQDRDLKKEEYCEEKKINLLLLYQGNEKLFNQIDLIEKELLDFIEYSKGENNDVKISYSDL